MLETTAERVPARSRLGVGARVVPARLGDRCLRHERRQPIALSGRDDVVDQALGDVGVSRAAGNP